VIGAGVRHIRRIGVSGGDQAIDEWGRWIALDLLNRGAGIVNVSVGLGKIVVLKSDVKDIANLGGGFCASGQAHNCRQRCARNHRGPARSAPADLLEQTHEISFPCRHNGRYLFPLISRLNTSRVRGSNREFPTFVLQSIKSARKRVQIHCDDPNRSARALLRAESSQIGLELYNSSKKLDGKLRREVQGGSTIHKGNAYLRCNVGGMAVSAMVATFSVSAATTGEPRLD
jgi:hypothetical protein